MNERFSLDETWTYCESMWIWIAAQIESGSVFSVEGLKAEWLSIHGFARVYNCGCFFCDYAYHANKRKGGMFMCRNHCPGKLVDPGFSCCHVDYHWTDNPIAFKNKIVAMNKMTVGP